MSHISKKHDAFSGLPFIESVELFSNDVVVHWHKKAVVGSGGGKAEDKSKRGVVKEFSEDSRKALAFVASNTSVIFRWMVTLTYPGEYSTDGKRVKKDLNRFLSWARSAGAGEYLWFIEFQARGAPHFHVLVENELVKADVSQRWYDAVGSGDEKHLAAGTRVEKIRLVDGAKRYAVKYGMKMRQKSVPENYASVGRFWGHSKGVKPQPLGMIGSMRHDELMELIDGWEYREKAEHIPLSTLYNAAGTVAKNLIDGELNNEKSGSKSIESEGRNRRGNNDVRAGRWVRFGDGGGSVWVDRSICRLYTGHSERLRVRYADGVAGSIVYYSVLHGGVVAGEDGVESGQR